MTPQEVRISVSHLACKSTTPPDTQHLLHQGEHQLRGPPAKTPLPAAPGVFGRDLCHPSIDSAQPCLASGVRQNDNTRWSGCRKLLFQKQSPTPVNKGHGRELKHTEINHPNSTHHDSPCTGPVITALAVGKEKGISPPRPGTH